MSKWEKNICAITERDGKYPQDSYAAVVRVIKLENIFLKRVTKDAGHALEGMEKFLQETFLPHLFLEKSKSLPPIVGTLSTMPVKKAVLCLQGTVTSSNERYLSFLHASSDLI